MRQNLSANFHKPRFFHFATDIEGRRLITDSGIHDDGGGIYVAALPENMNEPIDAFHLLLRPRSSWKKDTHIHPCLTPDGKTALFNSDESGILQAYVVKGIDSLNLAITTPAF